MKNRMRLIVKTTYTLEADSGSNMIAHGEIIKQYSSTKECEVDNANVVDYVAELNAEALGPIEKKLEQDITNLLKEEDNF